MSEILFNRATKLVFVSVDAKGVTQENAMVFDNNLRVVFEIEKSNSATPNTAKVSVYNMSDASRKHISIKSTRCQVHVGYQGRNPQFVYRKIFEGEIKKINTKKEKGAVITSFELADGIEQYRFARWDKSYPTGTKLVTVFNDLVKALGVPVDNVSTIRQSKKSYTNGLAASGLVRDQLTRLCTLAGYTWSMQSGALIVLPKDGNNLDEVVNLGPDTGLIGTPTHGKDGIIEWDSLIMAQLRPGSRVLLDSSTMVGVRTISKIKYSGDNTTGKWEAHYEGK